MRKNTLKGKDWIETREWSKPELDALLNLSYELKNKFKRGSPHRILPDKTLFMMFFEQSTRTRNSTEAAMTQLGGHAHYLDPGTMQISHGETPQDTGAVLSRYGHGIGIRNCFYGAGNRYIREVARHASVPVVNLQCDVDHPCQSIADLMTIQERFGGKGAKTNLRGLKFVICWTYAPAYARPLSVPQGLIWLMPRFGMDVTLAYPEEFYLMPHTVEIARRFAQENKTKFEIVHDMDEAFRGGHVLYAKSWGCQQWLNDQKVPKEKWKETGLEMISRYKSWVCNEQRMRHADRRGIYMHPLPADRGCEVIDAVIDGPQSVVYDQAENRLHTVKAILAATMEDGPPKPRTGRR